ncbi:MAG: DNA-processing protein DprA [Patescibacteria group bacterium]|jgi:DNA processing protein
MSKSNYTHNELLLLSGFYKIGPVGYQKLVASETDLIRCSASNLTQVGIKPQTAAEFIQFRDQFDVDYAREKLDECNVKTVAITDDEYPTMLKEITDPPYLLYVLGDTAVLNSVCLAVVGSRNHSHYGVAAVEKLIPDVVAHGITIVSGLAYGIDAKAHRMCVESEGKTVAVVGSGLDKLYPTDNQLLARDIIKTGGAIISEYPLGTAPLRQHFPARNRIISGISQATLVIECDIKSGAMITAHHAIDQNRDVLALPGTITSGFSAGPNRLIKMGAKLIESSQDIIENYNLSWSGNKNQLIAEPMKGHEQAVFELLSTDPVHIDQLIELSTLKSDEVGSALLFLEMKGLVRNIGAANYVRR